MKRMLSFALIVSLLIASIAFEAAAVPRLRGDASGDGKLNARDAVITALRIIGEDVGDAELADYDRNGAVNARDVTSLMRYLVGYYEANDELLELTYGVAEPVFDVPDPVTQSTVGAAAFGFDTAAADNCDAFAAAASYLAANPGTTLRLEQGTYRMGNKWVELSGIKDCVIDGGGSRFLYSDRNYFRIKNCEGLKLCNFSIDWDKNAYHIASLVRIKSYKNGVAEFEFFEETDASYALDIEDWGVMFHLDPEDLAPGMPGKGDWIASPDYIKTRSLTEPNVITSYVPDLPLYKGEVYLLRHFQYGAEAFNVERTSSLVFEDVAIHSGPSSGFYIQGYSHHVRFTRVAIEPDPDEFGRFPISTTADAFAIRDTQGYIIIDDCSVGYCYDDIMNIHDNVAYVTEATASNKVVIHAFNTSAFNVGDTLSFKNSEDLADLGDAKVTAIRWLPDSERELTLDCDLDSAVDFGTIVHDKTTDTANIIIRDSYFHQGRSRMILSGSDIVFENNRVYKTQLEPILIGCGIGVGTWATCEGEGVDNLIIRNNVFDSCNVRGQRDGTVIAFEAEFDMNPQGKLSGECFKNILIAHNRFVDPAGFISDSTNTKNLTLYGNTVELTRAPLSNAQNGRIGRIRLNRPYIEDTSILGNVCLDSPYLSAKANVVIISGVSGKTQITEDGNEIR